MTSVHYQADDNDNVNDLGLGDPGLFSIPSLSDFPPTKSDASIRSRQDEPTTKKNKRNKNDGTLGAIQQGISDMPDSAYIHTYLFQGNWYKSLRSMFLVSSRTTIRRLAYRSPVSVLQERSRHLASFPNVIHPYSAFRWYWDILMTLFLMVTLVSDPLRMTFFGHTLTESDTFHAQVGIVVTLMYLVDIILNFRTGLVDSRTQLVNLDPDAIAKNYVLGWFLFDILSSMPFDLIFILYKRSHGGSFAGEATLVEVVRVLELFKLFRLSRCVRYVSRLLLAYKVQGMYVRFIDHLLTVTYLTHWLACLQWLIPDMANAAHGPKKPGSWISRRGLWNVSFPEQYLNCYFRALTSQLAMTIDHSPTEWEEILVSVLNIIVGIIMVAYFIGHVSSILLSDGVPERKYVEVVNQVQEYLRFKQVPKELQKRIMLFYETRFQRNFFKEEEILHSVSDVLRKEILMHNCRHLVEQVPIFQGLSSTVIYAIVDKLQFQVYLPLDMVVTIHSVGETMYFIENGMVSILAENGRVIGHLKDGDFFGELSLISSEKRVASVVATSQVNAYILHRADFNVAMAGYPEILQRILKIAHGRINKINYVADIIRANDGNAKLEIQKELEAIAKQKRANRDSLSSSSSSSASTLV